MNGRLPYSCSYVFETSAYELLVREMLAKKRGFMNKEVDPFDDELVTNTTYAIRSGGVRGKYQNNTIRYN